MKITPLGRTKFRPYCLIFPGWRSVQVISLDGVFTANGPERCWQLLKRFEGHCAYVTGGLNGLLSTTGSSCWQAETWKGRATSMLLDGTKLRVSSLRRTLDDCVGPSETFDALSEALEWLGEQGVPPSSISAMSWSLFRSTLAEPLSAGFDAKIGRQALYGGRQEARGNKTYQHMSAVDLSKAYPHSMSARPYAATLREVTKDTRLDAQLSGIARARVTVPQDLPYPPLPMRVASDMIQWQWGIIEGTWSWCELAAARDLGCKVELLRCWAPLEEIDPFSAWFEVIKTGASSIAPPALPLFKAISNSLWGLFAMTDDDRASIRWNDDLCEEPYRVASSGRRMAQAATAHIAAETTARVRTRLLLEGLYADDTYPVHVDTDGIIVRTSSLPRRKLGDGPGEWRVKTTMPKIEVRAPQLYRYRCGKGCGIDHSPWHYVASGMGKEQARDLFDRVGRRAQVSISGFDLCLASGHTLEEDQRSRLMAQAAAVQLEAYGQPITGGIR